MTAPEHGLVPHVDGDVCYGSGSCIRLAPSVFVLDESQTAHVVDATAADAETLRLVERSCPSGAVTLRRLGGG